MDKETENKINQANKMLHEVACDEIDLCDDLLGLIHDSSATELQKNQMLVRLAQLRRVIANLTMRVDWHNENGD